MIRRKETTTDKEIEFWSSFGLNDQFISAYENLLEGVSKNDSGVIEKICEKRLVREWQKGISLVHEDKTEIELIKGETKVEVVDFHRAIGAYIDRETNLDMRVMVNPMRNKKKNFSLYSPVNIGKKDHLDYMIEICQLLVRFETSTKLNLVNHDGTKMIKNEENDEKEVHFALFESEIDRYNLGFF